jgi:hypothetical protein
VLDVANFLLGALNRLPAPIKSFLSFLIPGLGQIKGGFLAARIGIRAFSVSIGTAIVILGAIGRFGKTVFDPLIDAVQFAVRMFRRLPKPIQAVVTVFNPVLLAIRTFIHMLGGLDDAFDFLRNLGREIVEPIVDAFNWLVDTVKSILGIGSPSTVFIGIGQDIVRGLYVGLLQLAQLWLKGARFIVRHLIDGLKSLGPVLRRAGRWVIERIINGIKAAVQLVTELASWWWTHFRRGWGAIFNKLVDLGGEILTRLVNGIKRNVGLIVKVATRCTPCATESSSWAAGSSSASFRASGTSPASSSRSGRTSSRR